MPKTKIVDYRLRVCIDCAALSRASYQQAVDKYERSYQQPVDNLQIGENKKHNQIFVFFALASFI